MRYQLLKLTKNNSTKTERIFGELLKELHIPFKAKIKIQGREVDFIIGKYVIEIDGHLQENSKKNEILVKAGYIPIHIQNYEVYNRNKIKTFLKQIYKAFVDSEGDVVFAKGTTVPSGAGYVRGCIFLKTDGDVGTSLYINEGSITSADFTAVNGAPAERSRTATATGAGAGTIATGSRFVTVTGGPDVNQIIILPAPIVCS